MIGKLTGTVDGIAADRLILDVGGVGYEVMASAGVLRRAAPGARLALAIDTHVRQDAIVLYGFADEDERGWFRLLQSVQGVGAKIALSLLSALPEGALARAIALQDKAALQSADGVGGKLAARLLAELKDRMPASAALQIQRTRPAASMPAGVLDEAISALVNLGYRRPEAAEAVARASQAAGAGAALDALIKGGLRELAK